MFQIASFNIICTDSTEILFSKLRSAGSNYHLPNRKDFTFPYCAGVSNKQCLLPFYHIYCLNGRVTYVQLLYYVTLQI